uniref:Heme-binding protein n=1 Tax=Sphingomonas sp. KMG425 TaxID=191626 RepID=Q8RMH8_9SPHN|nr:unknown [Sphingomonas sp. KMG425]
MNGVATIPVGGTRSCRQGGARSRWAKGGKAACPLVRRSGWRHRETGRPVAPHRGPFPSSQIAQDKAYTAASFKVPSPDVYKMVAGNPALSGGIAAKPGIAMFGGGLPIAIAGEIVGAIECRAEPKNRIRSAQTQPSSRSGRRNIECPAIAALKQDATEN